MDYLYLIASVGFMSTSSIFGGFYTRRTKDKKAPVPLYNVIEAISCFFVWAILYAVNFTFEPKVLLYSLAMGACFTCCKIGTVNALRTGPVTLTSLINSLSLIGATIWGFIFWGAKVTPFAIVGILLVAVALALCLYGGKDEHKDGEENGTNKISLKWLLFVGMSFFGNMASTIIQRTQQTAFDGEHGNMLMFFSLIISVAVCGVFYGRSDKTDSVSLIKTSGAFPVAAGVGNVLLNLFVMLLATSSISPSIVYPTICIGGLSLTILTSLVVFKERLKWWQWIGIAIGATAVVLLNLG